MGRERVRVIYNTSEDAFKQGRRANEGVKEEYAYFQVVRALDHL